MLSRNSNFYRRFACISVGAIAAVSLAACGGDDKPAFCADRSNFQDSVAEIPKLAVAGNFSDLRTQLETVETEAGTLAESARDDYPQETDSIESAVQAVRTTVDGLPENPDSAELARVGLEAATAVSAVKNFVEATNSDCE